MCSKLVSSSWTIERRTKITVASSIKSRNRKKQAFNLRCICDRMPIGRVLRIWIVYEAIIKSAVEIQSLFYRITSLGKIYKQRENFSDNVRYEDPCSCSALPSSIYIYLYVNSNFSLFGAKSLSLNTKHTRWRNLQLIDHRFWFCAC